MMDNLYLGYFQENSFTKKFNKKTLIKIPKIFLKSRSLFIIFKLLYLDIHLGKDFNIVFYPSQHIPLLFSRNHKIFVTVHDLTPLFYSHGLKYFYYKFLLSHSLDKVSRIITASNNSKKDILDQYNLDSNKIKIVYSGVRREQEKWSMKKQNFILSIYRKEKWKNSDFIVDLFRDSDLKNLKLIFVGDLPKIHIKSKNISFLGKINEEKLHRLYSKAKTFLYLSLYEGFGFPILEAQAAGCPVITSNTSSMPEIAGNSAILVNPQNKDEIIEAIKRVLYDPKLSKRLITLGKKNVLRFSWERCARQYASEFKNG